MNSTLEETKGKLSQMEQSSAGAKDRIESLVKEIDEVVNRAFKAGVDLKSIQPIADALQFISTGKGEPERVIPAVDIFLRNLKIWLQTRQRLDVSTEMNIRYLREALER